MNALTKLRIGIDLDGVAAAFSERFKQIAEDLFGEPITAPQNTWTFDCWLSPEKQAAVYKRMRATKNFWETLGKLKGTDALAEAASDFELWFLTSRFETAGNSVQEQSCEWLTGNYALCYPHVVVGSEKGKVARALGLFAYLDDNVDYVREVQGAASSCRHTTYLKNASYNQDFDALANHIIRVPDLNSFLEALP